MGADQKFEALIVDFGGVLTSAVRPAMDKFLETEGIELDVFRAVMREWLAIGSLRNPIHDIETGAITDEQFEVALAAELSLRSGKRIEPVGLLSRMFVEPVHEENMYDVLRRARARGVKTALLSNSWGKEYPRERWDGLFDAIVISGEVGLRKPDAAIYQFTADQLGVRPDACVFVDDLRANITGAAEIGIVGIWHRDQAATIDELAVLFGW